VYQQLIANIQTNLIFYRRNRLLVAATLFIMLALGLTFVPSLFFLSNTQHLELVRMIFKQMNDFALIVTAGLGLLLVSQHIKDRSIKMVFTKPCLPETWLLSSFLSAGLVAFVIYAGSFFIASLLSALWSIPFPAGTIYLSAYDFFQTISLMAYATFLSVLFHPVLAAMILLVFREGMFYWLKILIASGIKAAGAKPLFPLLKPLKFLVDAIYMLLPTFNPYAEKSEKVYSSLRGSDADWNYLLPAIAYALAVTALFYFLTAYVLKKKRYV
jgi:ABC-type transport system involved in multi-copper enzyme maturation permease subunit